MWIVGASGLRRRRSYTAPSVAGNHFCCAAGWDYREHVRRRGIRSYGIRWEPTLQLELGPCSRFGFATRPETSERNYLRYTDESWNLSGDRDGSGLTVSGRTDDSPSLHNQYQRSAHTYYHLRNAAGGDGWTGLLL